MISLITLIVVLEVLLQLNKEALFYPFNYKNDRMAIIFHDNPYSNSWVLQKRNNKTYRILSSNEDYNADYYYTCFVVTHIKYVKTLHILFEVGSLYQIATNEEYKEVLDLMYNTKNHWHGGYRTGIDPQLLMRMI